MANPAPTINQINAFNATQGTTIDFNIIGGTELVRSNRIYIYDLSDNSLICTHLYVSTESIHELPPNTDGSIVYESGKSSADFVNGAQYYAQIQTFTDIGGTEGGSGLSVAKMFWCLDDPTLTIDTIPSTISTTSYNVSATYNANTSVVSNIIQQYQFSLYSATGSLLQSSGVIVGNGEQQGTSTAYDISYNFSGLSVGSSYYVVVDVTTTQGMSVSTQSGTFTVSIDTPTLGEATVVNNACDGYISVTSNLSSEYGGSGSGDIVSFETDSENVFTKLEVALEPIQDLNGYDYPWVGGAGVNKFDATKQTILDANKVSLSGETFTMSWTDGSIMITGRGVQTFPAGTYYFSAVGTGDMSNVRFGVYNASTNTEMRTSVPNFSFTATEDFYLIIYGLYSVPGTATFKVQIEQGSTATAWTPYENICPISGHDEVGVSVVGNAIIVNATDYIELPYPIKPNQSYGYKMIDTTPTEASRQFNIYDENKSYIDWWTPSTNETTKTNSSGTTLKYIRFRNAYDGVRRMAFRNVSENEQYTEQTYTTTLPETVYGGTLDLVSGVLTVDKQLTQITSWTGDFGQRTNGFAVYKTLSDRRNSPNTISNIFKSSFESVDVMQVGEYVGASGAYTTWSFILPSTITSLAEANTWLSNLSEPLVVTENLATPQTYQLTPQQIQTLVGVNNVWSEQGDIELAYHIPITNLLVKRQDVDDVSGNWLTLYSQPVEQASDMDFTFIDFLNQYGKTYKYALVPLLTQTQSGVEVEVEGGYTVSDEVQSIFDGVFISDSTGSQKCKANVGYGNVNMNQSVGSITPIGSQYPIIVTNSNNRYHNGSISGMIVPDDYYYNGNLSRIDMVNKRNELEQFLTNKRAKIIKDWNSNIWLVMIMDNIDCSFDNNYGMGIVTFNANWLEVGDPTNQEDLQATGLVDVGGV